MSSTPQSVHEGKADLEEPRVAITGNQTPSEAQAKPTQTVNQPPLGLPAEPNLASRLDANGCARVHKIDQLKTTRNSDISFDDLLGPLFPDSAPKKETVEVIKGENKPGGPEGITKEEEDRLLSRMIGMHKVAVELGKVVQKQNDTLKK